MKKHPSPTINDFTSLSTKDITLVRLADQSPEFRELCYAMPLCSVDEREACQLVGDTVRETVRFAVNTPTAHAGIVNGKVRGLFGIHGRIIWMLSDGYFKAHCPVQMHKIALGVIRTIRRMPSGYAVHNVIPADSPNIKWLQSLGFVFTAYTSERPELLMFHMFNP